MRRTQNSRHVVTVLVGQVFSFSNGSVAYEVTREGTPKRLGGKGVTWKCSCPANEIARRKKVEHGLAFHSNDPCKHLRLLYAMGASAKNNDGDVVMPRGVTIVLTEAGRKLLGIRNIVTAKVA